LRPQPSQLPPGLKTVAQIPGLEFPIRDSNAGRLPLACSSRSETMTADDLRSRPIQSNFQAMSLDMDIPQHVLDYQNIMGYSRAQYGLQIVHLERRWVKKTKTRLLADNIEEHYEDDVMRIYIEYFAPYRV
jgi:hypothetical protein